MVTKKSKLEPAQVQKLLEEKGYEFEMLRQQLAGIDQELQELHDRIGQFEGAKLTLEGLKDTKKGTDLLIPLGEGLFLKAGINNVKDVLIGVGSGVIVGKEMSKAIEYVQERIDEADTLINRLNSNAQLLLNQMRRLEPELRDLTQQSRAFKQARKK